MSDVFLSYSREDQATARRFAEAFEREGLSVWWDQTLRTGENYDRVTEAALREAKAVVVLWSTKSVDSQWVRAEATQADRLGTLMPVMIEPSNRPIMFELKHTAELAHWKGEPDDPAWKAFLSDVWRFAKSDAPQPVSAQPMVVPSRNVAGIATGIGVAGLAIAAVILWIASRSPDGPAAPPVTPATPVAAAGAEGVAAPITLAVLPFADMSAAKDQEYFSDGLTEEILNQLAQIKALRVTGRTSSFSFKGKNEDLRVIGKTLGVANLLEGSIRKDGNDLRITAQLINARDGAHLWSQSYDRELTKVFTLQEEIAKDVAKALSITLDVGDLPRAQGGTNNIEAYDKFLRAKQLVLRDGRQDSIQAAHLLREAVELDPQFTQAWMWLVNALGNQTERDPPDPVALAAELRAARDQVLQQAPQSSWAYRLYALEQMRGRKWADAETSLQLAAKRATMADSRMGVEQAIGNLLISVGRVREMVLIAERTRQQDPLSLLVSTDLQAALGFSGRMADADAEYQRSKSLPGDHGRADHFALLRLLSSGTASPLQVRSQFDTFLKSEPLPMALSVTLRGLLDDPEGARKAIRAALDDPANQHPIRQFIVSGYADAYGDRETAMLALQRSVKLSDKVSTVLIPIWYPYKTNLRSDPRFKTILKELDVVDYWRSTGKWGDFCKPVGTDDFECR